MGTGSREQNASKQESPIQLERKKAPVLSPTTCIAPPFARVLNDHTDAAPLRIARCHFTTQFVSAKPLS
jgi:hypothetical protein